MNTSKSHNAIMSVLTPWFPLTVAEIHACAPKVHRIEHRLAQLQARGRVRCSGLRHTMERGAELVYLPVYPPSNVNE